MNQYFKYLGCPIIVIALGAFLWLQNNYLGVTFLEYESPKIPLEFEDFSILQISDLHNKQFKKSQKELIRKTRQLQPDIIVVTGDLIDKRRTNNENMHVSLSYIEQATQVAPVYYVTGNHEGTSNLYRKLKSEMKSMGVHVLDDKIEQIVRNGEKINIAGINDISFYNNNLNALEQNLCRMLNDKHDLFNIVLAHRPDFLEACAVAKADLVFSGHTHGGQFILPFFGGVLDINENKKTKGMTEGVHRLDDTTVVISRGLGNSLIPIRLFNYPEMIYLKLKSKTE